MLHILYRDISSGSRCCYNVRNELIYTGDEGTKSSASTKHPWGSVSPNKWVRNVPSLSNWVHDIIPHCYCCMWSNSQDDCHGVYTKLRPTIGWKSYIAPDIGTVEQITYVASHPSLVRHTSRVEFLY